MWERRIRDMNAIKTRMKRKWSQEERADTVSCLLSTSTPPSLFLSRAGLQNALPPGTLIYKEKQCAALPACLPGGYICYNTNIIQATNEFVKSTIKRGEKTSAADIALPLASLPATYTSNIPGGCFASITFSIKSDISSKLNPGVETQTKTKGGEGRENSHVQWRARSHNMCVRARVCLPAALNRLHHQGERRY